MSRPRMPHRCSSCAMPSPRWAGRCNGCGDWNTLEPEPRPIALGSGSTRVEVEPDSAEALCDVDAASARPRPTGVAEFDRVVGGGLVPGSATLLGGEPGVGKSTLLLQVLMSMAGSGATVLLVSAEESARQVRLRAERIGPVPSGLLVSSGTEVGGIAELLGRTRPALLVVDSVQSVLHASTSGIPGSVSQVRACAEVLVRASSQLEVPVVLVGHVTKEGTLAGPRVLEHLVDTVLTVEGDRHHGVRLLRATKHRFGATGELGIFEMGEAGMSAVADPYHFLLGDRRPGVPGGVVFPAMEGRRALLVELQALVAPATAGVHPRRSAQGLDSGRLAVLLAVLDRRVCMPTGALDVFTSVVGGIRISEPAADVAIALAVASAASGIALPEDLAVFGEVGLGGELRQVPHVAQRLTESARLGFRRVLVPPNAPPGPPEVELLRVASLSEAIWYALPGLAAA